MSKAEQELEELNPEGVERSREVMTQMAMEIDRFLNPNQAEPTIGFALFTFEFGETEGRLNYVSNVEREQMQVAMASWFTKINEEETKQ